MNSLIHYFNKSLVHFRTHSRQTQTSSGPYHGLRTNKQARQTQTDSGPLHGLCTENKQINKQIKTIKQTNKQTNKQSRQTQTASGP